METWMRRSALWLAAVAVAGGLAPVAGTVAGADVQGWTYTPVTPERVLDTRGSGAGPVAGGRTISVDLSSELPATATAVVLNVTGTETSAGTFVTAFPHGAARPGVSSLNLAAGETRANLVTVRVNADRTVDLYNNAGGVHLIADLAGYYATGEAGRFTPRVAERVASVQVGAGSTQTVDLSSRVPVGATAVAVNVTGADVTASTFVTAFPAGTSRPVVSTLNATPGRATPNLAVVPLGAGRKISVYNNAGSVTVHLDLSGFYAPGLGAVFTPVAPARVLDTRTGAGTNASPAPVSAHVDMWPGGALPDNAIAAAMNVTGILPTKDTYVSTWKGDALGTSVLNLVPGQTSANQAVVPLYDRNPWSRSQFYNHEGTVDLAVDLAGYFWVPPVPCQAGCVSAWGYNRGGSQYGAGVLGTGVTNHQGYSPAPVIGLSGVEDLADRYAVKADGTVWSWGPNADGELGAGWIGGESTVPVQATGLTSVTAVAAGHLSGWALREDGTVWGWGRNESGILGVSVSGRTATPTQLRALSGITAIAMGDATGYALGSDGTVWALGDNTYGQLGGVDGPESWVPVQVSGLTDVVTIAAGWQAGYAIRADGTLWAWGSNLAGELGNGSSAQFSKVPVQVSGLTQVTAVAAGSSNAYALRQDGTVWGWGSDQLGQLGDGQQKTGSRVPVRIPGLPAATQLVATYAGGLVVDGAGQVWAWGSNSYGQLGVGEDGRITVPVQVPGLDSVTTLYPAETGARVVR
jgi:alpha-tubulin suppressor-like RCC1 family protein